MSTQAQEKKILSYLQTGKSITPIQALNKFGCFRLSARIYDLRKQGYPIETNNLKTKSGHVAQYFLVDVA